MLRISYASGVATAICVLIMIYGFDENIQIYPSVLYTAPHAEMAPFQRVWNPDTRSDYTIPDFSKESDGLDGDDGEKTLCGEDGSKCPELPAFNGEDYFDSKPIGLQIHALVMYNFHETIRTLSLVVSMIVISFLLYQFPLYFLNQQHYL
jgi:hypothetical protein